MHIALVNSEYPSPSGFDQGGIATYSYTMANALSAQGHKVELLLRHGTFPENLPDSVGVHFYKFKPPRKTVRILNFLNKNISDWELGHSHDICDLLKDMHKKSKIDIAELPDYGGLASAFSASLPFPIVVNFHTPSEIVDRINNVTITKTHRAFHLFEKNALRNCHGFRCPSVALKSEICRLFKIPETDITVIRNPVAIEHFDYISKIRNQDRFDILFAGRLERRKGAEVLIKSLSSLLQIDKRIYCTFAGNTEPGGQYHYRDALERSLTKDQRLRVFFSGPLTREKLSILYCRSSLFLFPSIFENAPYALFEAMAARLPVVATNSSGIKEIIRHGENGFLFKPDDIEDITTCVRSAFNDYEQSKYMAENAYANLKQQYNPQEIATESTKFYETIIARFQHQL